MYSNCLQLYLFPFLGPSSGSHQDTSLEHSVVQRCNRRKAVGWHWLDHFWYCIKNIHNGLRNIEFIAAVQPNQSNPSSGNGPFAWNGHITQKNTLLDGKRHRGARKTNWLYFIQKAYMNPYFQGPPVLFVIQQGDGFVQKMAPFATFSVI